MICFNCGRKLQSSSEKECQLCGVKFASVCPSCDFPNPSMAKYCFNCGKRITKSDSESSVQNFDTLSEGRSNVAVIFADVSGFTSISEKMDPEEIREILNDFFSYITKPVYEMEGTIDKYIGDCVMILFGAKFAHSDDARRAVFCAMKMLELAKTFSEERLSLKGLSLTLSIGINYGLVVTGSVGNYFDKDYTVMGDIVNTAQRLQSNAEKGNILVSEFVYNETKDIINYSKPKEIFVKNKKNPVRCYSPIKVDFGYSFEGTAPFIEREPEISLLNSLYNEALNEGTKCISVIGEAGVGKTRLLKEFASKLGSDVKVVWVDCSPMFQNRVYYILSNILMNIMNIGAQDNTSVKQRRLMSFVDYILGSLSSDEIKRNSDFLGLVLGLDRDNEFQNILDSMNFESINREILKQLSVFFTCLYKRGKLLIIVDDVHWSDLNSLNIINELALLLNNCNAAFILASRNKIESFNSDGGTRANIVKLNVFKESGIKNLSCKLLRCNDIDRALLNAIVKFTNGNPLYIKEFISNIKRTEKYYLSDDTAFAHKDEMGLLPNNIQNLILANFSELDDAVKSLLQAASVIGKDFSLSLAIDILNHTIVEESMLEMPVKLNIISLKSVHTTEGTVDKIFTFNQDTHREAIYDNILNKSKKEFHRRAGELIELKHAKDMENYYEIIQTHFEKAGLHKKAAEYCYKTAVKFKNNYNFTNALDYFNKFISMAEHISDEENKSKIIYAYKDMGQIGYILANYDEALENLNKALKLSVLSDDVYSINIMIAEIYKEQDLYENALDILNEIQPKIRQDSNIYGKVLQMKCNILRMICDPGALSIAKRSEKVLLKVKDFESLSETMNQAGIIYYTKGDIDNSLFYLNKSYRYAEKVNNLAAMAKVSGNMGIIYHSTGMISKALEFFNKSIDTSRKISDQQGYAIGCINLGVLYMDKGLFNKAEILFNEALEISQEILSRLNECVCLTNLGDVMYERGIYEKSEEYYQRSLEIAKSINVPIGEAINYLGLTRVLLKQRNSDKINDYLDTAYRIINETGEVEYLSDYYRYKSLFELNSGSIDTAMEYCEKSITCSEDCRSDRKRVKVLRLKADIFVQSGLPDNALELYDKSIILAGQLESDFESAKGFFGKFNALKSLNRDGEGEECMQKARENIAKVDTCRWTEIINKH